MTPHVPFFLTWPYTLRLALQCVQCSNTNVTFLKVKYDKYCAEYAPCAMLISHVHNSSRLLLECLSLELVLKLPFLVKVTVYFYIAYIIML